MSAGRGLCFISAIGALAALSTAGDDARACGGCFTGGGESTIVTAHRMALSVSTDRTVLWDQIRYQGDPEEFAWVLPVKPGATIELASDAFFEALDAATTTSVNRPPSAVCTPPPYEYDDGYYADGPGDDYAYMGCAVSGCSAGGERAEDLGGGGRAGGGSWATVTTTTTSEPPPPVEVVHEESIGPYEAVVLSSNEPGALYDWLLSHGYGVDPSMERMIDGYEAEGFDFVGLRLIPGAGTRQMKPVRVITPGASPVLPLRMVAAGTGANVALTLFMIGEGRWEAQSFPNAVVPTNEIDWDLASRSSTYGELRLAALAQNEGATWLTTYAKQGSLLSPVYNNVSMSSSLYLTTDGYGMSTIASLYAQQGVANGEFVDLACLQAFNTHAASGSKVVDPCAPPAGNDGGGGAGAGGAGAGGSGAGGGAGGAGAGGSMAVGGSGGAGGAGGAGAGGVNAGGSTGVGGSGAGGAGGGGAAQGAGGAMSGAGGSMAVGGAGGGEPEEPTCLGPAGPGMIDARQLVCGDLDDISVALVGMRPASVWLTRMEANLPRAALAQDLALQAAPDQSTIENWLFAATYTGDPCLASDVVRLPPKRTSPRRPPFGGDLLAIAATLATFLFAAARRQLRAATRKPAAARWSA